MRAKKQASQSSEDDATPVKLSQELQESAVTDTFGPHKKGKRRLHGLGAVLGDLADRPRRGRRPGSSSTRASNFDEMQSLHNVLNNQYNFLLEYASFLPPEVREQYIENITQAAFGSETLVNRMRLINNMLLHMLHQPPPLSWEETRDMYYRHTVCYPSDLFFIIKLNMQSFI